MNDRERMTNKVCGKCGRGFPECTREHGPIGSAECDRDRIRRATQRLIEVTGATGPMDLEQAVERILRLYSDATQANPGSSTVVMLLNETKALREAVLGAVVLRAICAKHAVDESFRVHLREHEWDEIVAKAGGR